MRKSVASYLVIALFLFLCLLPSLGILAWGESGAAANEILAPHPQWGATVLSDTANWLADRFALRQQMVTAWARLNALLGTSVEEQVILGRNGWLYYTPTLGDYTGEHLTDAELESIARHLAELQTEAEAAGAQFAFTVAPNKNSLYPEAMPSWAENRHEEANLIRLIPWLKQYGVHYTALTELPMPYYRTDSHWTAEGAAMAADALLDALGYPGGFTAGGFEAQGTHQGDLYEMLYPAALGAEEEIVYSGTLSYVCLNDPRDGNALTIRTAREGGEGRLYCWRDSFGAALYPYLAERFESAVFSRSQDYALPEDDYDVLILEIVERNLNRLLPGE